MSQQHGNQVLSVSHSFQGMTDEEKHGSCCHDSSNRWLRTIFPRCTSLLCDSFNPSTVLKCTAQHFIYHKLHEVLGPFVIPAKPKWWKKPGPMHQHTQPTWTHFYHQPVCDYLFHCGKPVWTPTDANPLTDKWMHTRTHSSDTYVYSHSLYKHTTIWHTHIHDPWVLAWWLWPGKESLHTSVEGI